MSEYIKISVQEKFKKIIETLPKEERWTDELDIYQYQGFWYRRCFLEGLMAAQENFKAEPTDIVLCSFQKTGTTWLKALSFAIVTRNRYGHNAGAGEGEYRHPLQTSVSHDFVTLLEGGIVFKGNDGSYGYKKDPNLPLLSTHVPYTSLPNSIVESTSGCKIVYIWRDPKDTFVSFWHFRKKFLENKETKQEFCFETEFERFCEGKWYYGPFWDHVLGFWNASLEYPNKILFLKYEDMKKDTLLYIRKLAEFMNQPFSKDEENEGVPRKIMELCSFQSMSNLEVNKTGKDLTATALGINNSFFFRKGEVGDWKTHLTMEMAEKIDAITNQKFDGTGLLL